MSSKYPLLVLASLGLLALSPRPLAAADFNISGSSTSAQTLNGNAGNNSGSVTATGSLTTSGSTVAVTVSGISSVTNSGTVRQSGSGRAIDSNSSGSNLTLTNNAGGRILSVSSDAIRVNNANSQVVLHNYGEISVSAGGQAIDWAAVTGTNILNNYSSGVISTVGEDAVRVGAGGQVNNAGTISATPTGTTDPSGSDGIDIRRLSGITVTNTGSISGRHGIATDGGSTALTFTLFNNAGTISAFNGSGVNIDGVTTNVVANITNAAGATIQGGVSASALESDGDGIDVDGVLNLTNSGTVYGVGAKGPSNAEGIAMGGGTIVNHSNGQIIGASSAGDSSKLGNGILVDDSDGGNAIAATGITNHGLIQGETGFAVKIVGTFNDTIVNSATGTIQGNGSVESAGAAIQTGDGADTVTNAGAILGGNGKAIDLQAGNDTLNLEGGSVSGDMDGGTGSNTLNVAAGNGAVETDGAVDNFNTANVQSGRWNHSGSISSGTAISITGGILNYTGAGNLGSNITVNGGEFKNNGGNFTGSLDLVSGTVSGTNLSGVELTIGANQTLSPGNSPGTMETAGQTWASAGTYLWEINALAEDGGSQGGDPGWDFLDITGTLDITATAENKFNIEIDALSLLDSWDNSQDYVFVIASASDGINGFDESLFSLSIAGFINQHSLDGGSFSLQVNGNNLELHYNAVPEPSTYALLLLGLASMGWAWHRRKNRPSAAA